MLEKIFNVFFQAKEINFEEKISKAINDDDIKALQSLIDNKGKANYCIRNNMCPILYAALSSCKYHIAIYLLSIGADPNGVNKRNNWFPLYFAVSNELESSIRLLIIYGANSDSYLPNNLCTAKSLAKEKGLLNLVVNTEKKYHELQNLKEKYESAKCQADKAFKEPTIELAGKLYQQAAYIYKDISQLWLDLYREEKNSVLKNHYHEKHTDYMNKAIELENLQCGLKSNKNEDKIVTVSPSLLYRKKHLQKYQPINPTGEDENKEATMSHHFL